MIAPESLAAAVMIKFTGVVPSLRRMTALVVQPAGAVLASTASNCGHDVNPLAHSHDEALDFHRLQPIKSLASRTAITVAVDCFVSNEGLMGNLHWRRVASGIALVIATLALVLLHKLNYSREHQFFGIALVGVFGFLFLSSSEPAQDEPWW